MARVGDWKLSGVGATFEHMSDTKLRPVTFQARPSTPTARTPGPSATRSVLAALSIRVVPAAWRRRRRTVVAAAAPATLIHPPRRELTPSGPAGLGLESARQ